MGLTLLGGTGQDMTAMLADLQAQVTATQAKADASMTVANSARTTANAQTAPIGQLQQFAQQYGSTAAAADAIHAQLQAQIDALKALQVTIGYGTAALTGSLLAGAVSTVTVTLSRNMGSASYSVGTGLVGGTSLLGSLAIAGVTAQTATTVTMQVRNGGLTALANLSGAVVHVVAAREA